MYLNAKSLVDSYDADETTLTLDNNKILSISEKKYTKFKKEIQKHLNNL